MKKQLLTLIFLLVLGFSYAQQSNHWTTITGTQYNLTMSGVIYIDGVAQTSSVFEIGAFCGNECRGSARAQLFPPTGDYVVSLTVVSDQPNGETITFRLYDHGTQQEFPSECANNITFNANDNYGAMGNWYSFAFVGEVPEYEITVLANPVDGGTVFGAGTYSEGDLCTLTVMVNDAYTFVNWTKDGIEVSTSPTYSFTVMESASYTANFMEALTANHWTTILGTQYNLTMSGVISIDGIAQTSTALEVGAFCGNECRGSARAQFFPPTGDYVVSLTVVSNQLNGETITFGLFDHRIQQEYSNDCVNRITFNANDNYGAMGNWYEFSFMTPTIPQTFTLPINGYGEGAGGYYLIASPVTEVAPSVENGFLTGEYDLYYFDQSQEMEWQNYKANSFNLVSGKGYLYASKTNTTLTFTGEPYIGNGNVTLNYNEGANFAGWNLVGNPYSVTAYIDRDFYVMREDGEEIIPGNGNAIAPMQGIFVIADSNGEEMTFSTNAPTNNGSKVVVNIRRKHGDVIDRVMVRFDGGAMLPKHMLHPKNTKLYISESEKEYAVVCNNGNNITPVCFCAAEDGTYTLNVEVENMEMEYLHLIDNMTGADIDLLQTPEYTFQARTTDNASRFQLIFANTSEHDE